MKIFYDSGKKIDKDGNAIKKGIPYINKEKQKLKLERKLKEAKRKLLKREGK